MKTSRTYKLHLSNEGISLFLECHNRLAHLLREFIPYGLTLSIAVAVLDRQEPCDIASEIASPRFKKCLGTNIRYVGSSMTTARIITQIADTLVESNEFAAPPKVVHMHLVAVLFLSSAEDEEIIGALRRSDVKKRAMRF